MFSNNPGLTNLVEHEIQLVSDQPVKDEALSRDVAPTNEILKNEINRMDIGKYLWVKQHSDTQPSVLAFGTYRLRMSFGLKNVHISLVNFMAELLNGLEDFVVRI
ncbi:hypothetical protein TNCV_3334801 [Trichonephila clavipes]|nr:hypothetical protein TNCV_3334801 [Trichonephila clavipes]